MAPRFSCWNTVTITVLSCIQDGGMAHCLGLGPSYMAWTSFLPRSFLTLQIQFVGKISLSRGIWGMLQLLGHCYLLGQATPRRLWYGLPCHNSMQHLPTLLSWVGELVWRDLPSASYWICILASALFLREKFFWSVAYAIEWIHGCLAKYELVVTIKICFVQLNCSQLFYKAYSSNLFEHNL